MATTCIVTLKTILNCFRMGVGAELRMSHCVLGTIAETAPEAYGHVLLRYEVTRFCSQSLGIHPTRSTVRTSPSKRKK